MTTAVTLYGKNNEVAAFNTYKDENPSYNVQKTGLWVNPKYPQLGCSHDGITQHTTTGVTGLRN